jgi:hypothetical protein
MPWISTKMLIIMVTNHKWLVFEAAAAKQQAKYYALLISSILVDYQLFWQNIWHKIVHECLENAQTAFICSLMTYLCDFWWRFCVLDISDQWIALHIETSRTGVQPSVAKWPKQGVGCCCALQAMCWQYWLVCTCGQWLWAVAIYKWVHILVWYLQGLQNVSQIK